MIETCSLHPSAKIESRGKMFFMATYRDIPLAKALVLKFCTIIPGSQMAKIEELVSRLGLNIESVTQEAHCKIVRVTGETKQLEAMDQELVRHASISRKIVSVMKKSDLTQSIEESPSKVGMRD